jgi:hypothetical protein
MELRSGRDFNWIGAVIYDDEYIKVGEPPQLVTAQQRCRSYRSAHSRAVRTRAFTLGH